MGRRRALLVHNSKFIDPNLAPLTAASGDVRKLAELLQTDFVGFDPSEITLLENPSLGDFRAAVSQFYRDAKRDDYLFFYYAGHGIRGEGGELYLALRNTTLENYEALALEANYIRRNLERCFAQSKVLLLDCCNASAFREDGQYVARDAGFDAGQMAANFNPKGSGTYILGASQSGASAYETIDENGNAYSLFTHHLIEGVTTGQAAPGRPHINWTDIGAYIHSQRKSEGILTTPYIDMTNAAGLLEFCKNPQIEPQPVVTTETSKPPPTKNDSRKMAIWPFALGVGVIAVGAVAMITQNVETPLAPDAPDINNVVTQMSLKDSVRNQPAPQMPPIENQPVILPTLKPIHPTKPLSLPDGLQTIDPFSTFPEIGLGHDQICARRRGLLVDLSNPSYWAPNLATGTKLYEYGSAPNTWLTLPDTAQKFDSYEFNVEFCSCYEEDATAELHRVRADDSLQLFLGGDDFVENFPSPDFVHKTTLMDTSRGTRAFTVVVDNGVNGGPFGFSLAGTLSSQNSYLGRCR
jgi:hypothetical protein